GTDLRVRWLTVARAVARPVVGVTRLSNRAAAVGDGDPPALKVKVYLGPVTGGPASARIGIVTEENKFVVYACSQDEAFNAAASRWITGTPGAGSNIEGTAGKVSVKAAIKGDSAEGTLTTSDGK